MRRWTLLIACVQLCRLGPLGLRSESNATSHEFFSLARIGDLIARETEFYHILSVTDIVSVTVLGTIKREYYGRMKSEKQHTRGVFFKKKAKGRSGRFEETVGYDEP